MTTSTKRCLPEGSTWGNKTRKVSFPLGILSSSIVIIGNMEVVEGTSTLSNDFVHSMYVKAGEITGMPSSNFTYANVQPATATVVDQVTQADLTCQYNWLERIEHLERDHFELKKENAEKRMRALIGKGREEYWRRYKDAFILQFPQYIRDEDVGYDDKLEPITVPRPKKWKQFIEFVRRIGDNKSKDYLALLGGGQDSEYAELSAEVHNPSETILAQSIELLDRSDYRQLFNDIFNRPAAALSAKASSSAKAFVK